MPWCPGRPKGGNRVRIRAAAPVAVAGPVNGPRRTRSLVTPQHRREGVTLSRRATESTDQMRTGDTALDHPARRLTGVLLVRAKGIAFSRDWLPSQPSARAL